MIQLLLVSCFFKKIAHWLAIELCNPLKFDDIHPALAKFTLRDEAVGLAEGLGDGFLEQTCVVPRFDQALTECLVRFLICGISFVHS